MWYFRIIEKTMNLKSQRKNTNYLTADDEEKN